MTPDRDGIQVRREDFRIKRYKQRHESYRHLRRRCLGLGGASAHGREAKGAVELHPG
ncbi:MAG: hypothetical protein U1F47_02270 [Hyphomicrobiales bacterium]